jgi:hypothetical protein
MCFWDPSGRVSDLHRILNRMAISLDLAANEFRRETAA